MKRLITLWAAVVVPLLPVAAAPAGSAPRSPGADAAGTASASRSAVEPTSGLPGFNDWPLVFDDEFRGHTLNTAVWRPGWFGSGISGPVNTAEKQGYDSRNVTESGGRLNLALTSHYGALVSTNPHDGRASGGFEFTGPALMEARIHTPGRTSVDNWPAFWSDGQNFPANGEIDTMEGLGGKLCFHVHDRAGSPGDCSKLRPGWHTYASYWNTDTRTVTFYYDDHKVAQEPFANGEAPQYLILDNTSSATPVPDTMLVDRVRVWQRGSAHGCGSGRGPIVLSQKGVSTISLAPPNCYVPLRLP